MFRGFIFARQK